MRVTWRLLFLPGGDLRSAKVVEVIWEGEPLELRGRCGCLWNVMGVPLFPPWFSPPFVDSLLRSKLAGTSLAVGTLQKRYSFFEPEAEQSNSWPLSLSLGKENSRGGGKETNGSTRACHVRSSMLVASTHAF